MLKSIDETLATLYVSTQLEQNRSEDNDMAHEISQRIRNDRKKWHHEMTQNGTRNDKKEWHNEMTQNGTRNGKKKWHNKCQKEMTQ